jgi:hypothetical protein
MTSEYTPKVDAEIAELVTALATVCDSRDMRVVLAATAHLLSSVIIARNTSLAGVEAFAEMFHEELRAQWLIAHDASNNGGGEEPPAA